MEFTNTFTVPVEPAEAFAVLTDLERVAPCMPGATLEEVEGDTYYGRVKVKVGPMSVTYKGSATLVEADKDGLTAAIEASGSEARGSGTANAKVRATLREVDGGTEVTVDTELSITGKPAQFGRGVMADVGSKIIDKFAECLATTLEPGEPTDTTEPAATPAPETVEAAEAAGEEAAARPAADTAAGGEAVATGARAAGSNGQRRRVEHVAPKEDALDLMEVAGSATVRRVLPLVAALLAAVGLVWWWRRR